MTKARSPKQCAVEGCDQPLVARGYCRLHYGHWKLHGHPWINKPRVCIPCNVIGCGRVARAGKKGGRPVCALHHARLLRHGAVDVLKKPRKHDDAAKHRACTRCKELLPTISFIELLSPGPGRSKFASWCRDCRNASRRDKRNRSRDDWLQALRAAADQRRQRNAASRAERELRLVELRRERAEASLLAGSRFKQWSQDLDDKYVRRLMAKRSAILKPSDIPLMLVQAKREQLRIMRFLNEKGEDE